MTSTGCGGGHLLFVSVPAPVVPLLAVVEENDLAVRADLGELGLAVIAEPI